MRAGIRLRRARQYKTDVASSHHASPRATQRTMPAMASSVGAAWSHVLKFAQSTRQRGTEPIQVRPTTAMTSKAISASS
jgi:hypothetical protein